MLNLSSSRTIILRLRLGMAPCVKQVTLPDLPLMDEFRVVLDCLGRHEYLMLCDSFEEV